MCMNKLQFEDMQYKFRQPSTQVEGSTSQLPEEKAHSKDTHALPITFLQFAVTGHRCFEGSNWSLGCLKMSIVINQLAIKVQNQGICALRG